MFPWSTREQDSFHKDRSTVSPEGGWALVKEFFGKAVLSMAAQGGLLHGAVQQTEKNFFQRRAGRGGEWAKTLLLQGVQGFAAQRWAVQNDGGVLGRADCSCEADEIMLT
nr:MAG TPA: hypothetical protein [Caudoviricetes sp.]